MPRSRSTAIQSERTRRRSPRLNLARQLDRPTKQQQFLGQGGLAGVRMLINRLSLEPGIGAVAGKKSRCARITGGYDDRSAVCQLVSSGQKRVLFATIRNDKLQVRFLVTAFSPSQNQNFLFSCNHSPVSGGSTLHHPFRCHRCQVKSPCLTNGREVGQSFMIQ